MKCESSCFSWCAWVYFNTLRAKNPLLTTVIIEWAVFLARLRNLPFNLARWLQHLS